MSAFQWRLSFSDNLSAFSIPLISYSWLICYLILHFIYFILFFISVGIFPWYVSPIFLVHTIFSLFVPYNSLWIDSSSLYSLFLSFYFSMWNDFSHHIDSLLFFLLSIFLPSVKWPLTSHCTFLLSVYQITSFFHFTYLTWPNCQLIR